MYYSVHYTYKYTSSGKEVILHAKMTLPDLQRYPRNLVNNVEDISVLLGLKVLS